MSGKEDGTRTRMHKLKGSVLAGVAAGVLAIIGFLAFEAWNHRGGRMHGESDHDFRRRSRENN